MTRLSNVLIHSAGRIGVLKFALTLKRRSPPLILMYHGISSLAEMPNSLRNWEGKQMAMDLFVNHLRILHRSRQVISLSELVFGLENRQDMSNTAVITFDDGYENNALIAAPVLADFKMSAAFFLTTGLIGTESCIWTDRLEIALGRTDSVRVQLPGDAGYMPLHSFADKRRALVRIKAMLKLEATQNVEDVIDKIIHLLGVADICPDGDYRFMKWDQARELVQAGFEVGAHTITHPILSRIPFEAAVAEILGSKNKIQLETGQCSSTFCFPNGKRSDFNAELIAMCRRNFTAALSSERGAATVGDIFELKRLSPAGQGQGENLEWLLLNTR